MKKITLALFGVLVLIVLGVLLVPHLIDWNRYKPEISQAVREATGRELTIGGDIELSILPNLSFALSDVVLANAEGAVEPRMFSLGRIEGSVRIFPLIRRKVVIDRLIASNPVVHLEVTADGRPNWAFEGGRKAGDTPTEKPAAREGLPISDLTLGDVRLEDGLVTYRDARTGQQVVAKAMNLKVALDGLATPFTLHGQLTLNEEPVTLELTMDSPGGLLEGTRAALATSLESRHFRLSYDGGLRQQPIPALDGTFDLATPSVGKLAAWLQRPLAAKQPDPGPLRVHAVLAGEGAKMTLVQATVAGDALQAKATGGFDGSGEITRLTFDLSAGVLDLDRYLPPPIRQAPAEGPARSPEPRGKKTEGKEPRDAFAVFGEDPFDLAPLKHTEAEVKIAIGGIKALGHEVGKIGFDASLRGGVLAASLNVLKTYGGSVTGTLRLDGAQDQLGVETDLTIAKLDVGALSRAARGDSAKLAGIANGRLQAKGRGANPRALVKSLVASATLALGGVDVKDAPGAISQLSLAVDLPGVNDKPSVTGNLVYNKEALDFSLGLDPLPKVLSGERFAAQVAVESKRVKLSYDGAVQSEPVPGLDGRFALDVPSVGALLAWLERPLPKGQPDPGALTVRAELAADGPRVALKQATVEGKSLQAKAVGSYDGTGPIAKVVFNLETGVLDLDRYLPPPTAKPAAARPKTPEPLGDPLAAIPDEPFDLKQLHATEADVSIAVGGVNAAGYTVGKTALTAVLKGGVLNAALEELRLYGGNLAGRVRLDGSGDSLGAETALTMDGVDVGALAHAAQGEEAKVVGIAGGRLQAEGRGKNPRALAESLAAEGNLQLAGLDIKGAAAGALTAAAVQFDVPGFGRPVTLKGTATYNKEDVSLALDLAPLKQVLSGRAFELTAAVASKLVTARYGGKVQSRPAPGLDGSLDLDVPSVGKLAAWVGQPLATQQPDPGPLKIKAVVRADGAAAAIKEVTIEGKALRARAAASIDASRDVKRFDAEVEISEADLNAYLPPRKDTPTQKPAAPAGPSGWSEEPIDVSPLRQAEGQAVLKVGKVRYGDLEIQAGTATVTLAQGVLKAVVDKVQLAGGALDLTTSVDGSKQTPAVDYQVTVAGVRARPLLKTFAGSDRLSGTTEFQASGATRGASQKQLVGGLNGQGRFLFKDGAIHGINLAAALRKAATLNFSDSAEQKTDFAELSGSFTITNGVLENRDLKMFAPLLRLTGGGRVPLPPRTIDYTAEVKLVASLEGQGGQDALAGLPIPVSIRGSWDSPAYGVDWNSVFAEAAKDPSRLANMPSELRDFGKGLGVKLPLPGAGTNGGADSGDGLGKILKAIPGLGGAQPQPPAGEPAPKPQTPGGTVDPQQQPQEEQQKQRQQAPDPLQGLKKLFKN